VWKQTHHHLAPTQVSPQDTRDKCMNISNRFCWGEQRGMVTVAQRKQHIPAEGRVKIEWRRGKHPEMPCCPADLLGGPGPPTVAAET
jgi:hypothetical protein